MPERSHAVGRDGSVEGHVESVLSNHEVVLFTHEVPPDSRCRFSRQAVALVDAHREEYAVVDVLGEADAYRSALHDRSGWATIPQVYVAGEFVGDGDVLAALGDRDELAETLRV
ncbi:glutaredoxin [Halobacteriales archaeon QS_8_69_26]|nr:MAG: glutaredoxin [Halobacteriales archaeon QS_8_69_26]